MSKLYKEIIKLYKEIRPTDLNEKKLYVDISNRTIDVVKRYFDPVVTIRLTNRSMSFDVCEFGKLKFEFYTDLVYQLEDEWFILAIVDNGKTRYYLCDQLDGLEEALIDYKNNKIIGLLYKHDKSS